MTYANADSLVATGWLADRLGDPGIRIVDATWYLPGVDRSGREEYAARHIPGAVYWDLDEIADPADPLPHMLPDAPTFAGHMARLGIGDGMKVVVYDSVGSMTAPRVWWMLRSFGHDAVSVLDGGLTKWLAEGRPTDSEAPTSATVAAIEESFALAPAFAAAQLVSAECSATLCRVEVTRDGAGDAEDLSDLEDELLIEWADRLPSGSVDVEWDEAGTAHIVVYYARKDHRLPRPDDATR